MGIQKMTELGLKTPESYEGVYVFGEMDGKVVKLPYGGIDESVIKEAITTYLEENGTTTGVGISSITQIASSTASGGTNTWRVTLTDGTFYDLTIYNGAQGASGSSSSGGSGTDGVGITSVEQTTTSTTSGGKNVVTITLTDGSTYTFSVYNGAKGDTGATGATGAQGEAGEDGKSAYEYAVAGGYTGTEDDFALACANLKSDPLYGKTVVCFGDSLMTGGDSAGSANNGFARLITNRHPGATVYNYAIGGSVLSQNAYTLSKNNGDTRSNILEVIYAATKDTSTYPGMADPDYIVISGGGNDFYTSYLYNSSLVDDIFGVADLSTVGEIASDDTVYNAIDYMFSSLIQIYPTAKIMLITPYTIFGLGFSLATQREIIGNIAGICEKYGVCLFALEQTELGVRRYAYPYTSTGTLFKDNLHPSEDGYDFIAEAFDSCLTTGISNYQYSAQTTFDITLSGSISSTSLTAYTADRTYSEILLAYNAGKTLRVIDGTGCVLDLCAHDSNGSFMFSTTAYLSGTGIVGLCCYITTSSGNTMYGLTAALS